MSNHSSFCKARRWSLAWGLLLACVWLHASALATSGQILAARLRVVSVSPPVLGIDGDARRATAQWPFRNTYGGVIGLGDRVEHFRVVDAVGSDVPVIRVSSAEFRSEQPASHFSYEVRLSLPAKAADGAHVSWLNEQGGYLMLADLLPSLVGGNQRGSAVRIELQLPVGWRLASSLKANRKGWYETSEPSQAVFFVGRELQLEQKEIGGLEFVFASLGEWPFTSESVHKIASRIIKDYAQHVGLALTGRVLLMLSPFPGAAGSDRWSAETRGTSVTLLLDRNSSREVLLERLSVLLTHELFHLWVPNSLPLDGAYDWFFEGFTLYQALCSAVRLGFIDFGEYLRTIARVYDSYLLTPDSARLSLIEGSERRWTTPSLAYDKGMLVALLCDLALRRASGNRRSLDNLYRELFRQHFPGSIRVEGNKTLVDLLNHETENVKFLARYVSTSGMMKLETELAPYGLIMERAASRSHLKVQPGLDREQLVMLRSLGYRSARK